MYFDYSSSVELTATTSNDFGTQAHRSTFSGSLQTFEETTVDSFGIGYGLITIAKQQR